MGRRAVAVRGCVGGGGHISTACAVYVGGFLRENAMHAALFHFPLNKIPTRDVLGCVFCLFERNEKKNWFVRCGQLNPGGGTRNRSMVMQSVEMQPVEMQPVEMQPAPQVDTP